jgi:hypothetical protein
MLAAAITAGVCSAIFGLTEEQIAFSSPLSLALMAGWTAALWFAFGPLRWRA